MSFNRSDLRESLLNNESDSIDSIVYRDPKTIQQSLRSKRSSKPKSKYRSPGKSTDRSNESHPDDHMVELQVSSPRNNNFDRVLPVLDPVATPSDAPPHDFILFDIPVEEEKEEKQAANPAENAIAEEKKDDAIHNYIVYGLVLLYFAPAAIFSEVPFAYYCYRNTQKGIEIYARVLTGDADLNELDPYRYYIKHTAAYISFYSEFVNGCTQFSITKVAKQIDNLFYQTEFMPMPQRLCYAMFHEPIFVIYATIMWGLFFTGSLGTAWGALDEVYNSWMEALGEVMGPIALWILFSGGLTYALLSFTERSAAGIRSWYGNPTSDLWKRLKNHKSPAIEAQYLQENFVTTFVRLISISYLWGGITEKVKAINIPKSVGHVIGAAGGTGQMLSFFWSGTFSKYHKHVSPLLIKAATQEENEKRVKAKLPKIRQPKAPTNDERSVVIGAHRIELSYCKRLFEELKRPLYIGYANMGLAYYAIKFGVGNTLLFPLLTTVASDTTAHVVINITSSIAAIAAYYPYYIADKYRHANDWVVAARNANAQAVRIMEEPESYTVWFLGTSAAFGMVSCRVAILLANMVENEDLGPYFSEQTWAVICTHAGIVVGDNRYYAMLDNSKKSIKDLGETAYQLGSWLARGGQSCVNGMYNFFNREASRAQVINAVEDQPYVRLI